MDAGNDYKINHQRMLNFGSSVYEQPNEIGLPVAFFDSMTVLAQLKAHIKRATKRGVITRQVHTYENTIFKLKKQPPKMKYLPTISYLFQRCHL